MKILDHRAAFRFQAGQLVVQDVLIQRFSIGGARTPRGYEKGLLGVRTFLIIQKTIHTMVQKLFLLPDGVRASK